MGYEVKSAKAELGVIKTLIAVLLFAGALPAQTNSLAHVSIWEKASRHKLLIFSYVAVSAAAIGDWHTTIQCVHVPNGACSEANPVLLAAGIDPAGAHGSQQLLGLKLGLIAGAIGGGEFVRRKRWISERGESFLLLGVAAAQTGVDVHNRIVTYRVQK